MVPVMLVLVVALIAATGYLYYQLNQTRAEVAQMRDQLLDEISKMCSVESSFAELHLAVRNHCF